MAIGGLTVWVVGLSPLANPAVWWRKLHAFHCGPDIKIGIMQFSIFHRVPEVWIVDSVDHGADLLHDLRLVDHRPIEIICLGVLGELGRWNIRSISPLRRALTSNSAAPQSFLTILKNIWKTLATYRSPFIACFCCAAINHQPRWH
jgi:hypothetical protein